MVGLLGTVFGLWLGQRRWSSEQKMQKRRAFDAKRHAAYEELWNTVEGSHIAIRTSCPDESQLRDLEQKINAFRLRNAIYLSSQDSDLASEYFTEVVKLSKLVADSGSPLLQRDFASTIVGIQQAPTELTVADYRVSNTRAKLIERIQAVMLETSYAVSKTG
jgi:hypothetical protein